MVGQIEAVTICYRNPASGGNSRQIPPHKINRIREVSTIRALMASLSNIVLPGSVKNLSKSISTREPRPRQESEETISLWPCIGQKSRLLMDNRKKQRGWDSMLMLCCSGGLFPLRKSLIDRTDIIKIHPSMLSTPTEQEHQD